MKLEFHRAKSDRNKSDPSRGFGFEMAAYFDWDNAITIEDKRKEYGEARYITYGMVGKRLHVMVWTPREPNIRRVISLRKANKREEQYYEKYKK